MLERFLLLLGGLEIIVGGIVTAYPTWLPPSAGLFMIAVGVVTVLAALVLMFGDFRKGRVRGASASLVPQWHFHATFDDILPFRRTILLTEAAQYGRDETVLRRAGDASEQLSMKNDPVSWMATALGMKETYDGSKFPGPLRLYGRRFNSTRRVLIPMEDRNRLTIVDRGAALREPGGKKNIYTHLEVLRFEMKKRIRYLRGME